MGGVAKTIGQGAADVFSLGTDRIAQNNLPSNSVVNQALNFPGTVLTGGMYNPGNLGRVNLGGPSSTIPGPFTLDPNQVNSDQSQLTMLGNQQQSDINSLASQQNKMANAMLGTQYGQANQLGQSQFDQANQLASQQYQQTLGLIPGTVDNELQLENPQIMEGLNSNGLLTSSAYPTAIAQQQAQLTDQLAIPAEQQFQAAQTAAQGGLQGTQQSALSGLISGQQGAEQGLFSGQQSGLTTNQGLQTGAVQRGLSLEDQINNANISKTIGQVFAPQPPSGKAQAGTALQGVGAVAPWFAKGGALGKAGTAASTLPAV